MAGRSGQRRTWRSRARTAPGVRAALTRLGKRVRLLREQQELSQEETADRAHVDAKHLQAIEAGRTNPTVATLLGIAKALHVELHKLFTAT